MARLRLPPVALRFGRFAVVGCTGFLIDSGLLALLHHGLGVDPFSARLVSMACAGLTTWRLNRLVTFGASSATQAREGMRYAGVTALTASLNYCVYALALTLVPHLWPLAALVLASVNIFGGFLVTQRMLAMYQKKEKK